MLSGRHFKDPGRQTARTLLQLDERMLPVTRDESFAVGPLTTIRKSWLRSYE